MKTLILRLIDRLGYEIWRKDRPQDRPRSSMQKAMEWLRNNRFDIKTVIDIGASDGQWTRACMNWLDANYVLFEPQPCHSNALDAFNEEFNGNVTIIKKAAGAKVGKTYFDITDPFGGALKNTKSIGAIEVDLTTIDETVREKGIKGPFLLKLDTHGFEVPILEGAEDLLKQCEVLIIEAYNYNIEPDSLLFWQLCEYLYKKGFRPIDMVDISHRKYDDSLWQMDLVFIKSSWSGYKHISYT